MRLPTRRILFTLAQAVVFSAGYLLAPAADQPAPPVTPATPERLVLDQARQARDFAEKQPAAGLISEPNYVAAQADADIAQAALTSNAAFVQDVKTFYARWELALLVQLQQTGRLAPKDRADILGFKFVAEVPGDAAPAPDRHTQDWGPATNGVRVKLVRDQDVWPLDQTPVLQATVRTASGGNITVAPALATAVLEVDGLRYHWAGLPDTSAPPPGKIPVLLSTDWLDAEGRPFQPSPGLHTVRYATLIDPTVVKTASAPFYTFSNPELFEWRTPHHWPDAPVFPELSEDYSAPKPALPSLDLGKVSKDEAWTRLVANVRQQVAQLWPGAVVTDNHDDETLTVRYHPRTYEFFAYSKNKGARAYPFLNEGPAEDGVLAQISFTDIDYSQTARESASTAPDKSPPDLALWRDYSGSVHLSNPGTYLHAQLSYGPLADPQKLTQFLSPGAWLKAPPPAPPAPDAKKTTTP